MSSMDAKYTEDTIEDVTGVRSSNNARCTEKETTNALRNRISVVSSNKETQEIETISEAKRKANGICRASVVWKIIKYAIFITCFSFLFKQSMDFCNYYLTYPVTTSIVVRNSKIIQKPAVTICNHNPFRRSTFCADYPEYCEKPNKLDEFCQKHPHFCKGNVSNLMMPNLYYHTEEDDRRRIDELIYESYFNFSHEKPFIEVCMRWRQSFKPVLIDDPVLSEHGARFAKCYSANLHLLSNEYPETKEVVHSEEFDLEDEIIFCFDLNVREDDMFYPWAENYVTFSIHSPFVPPNLFYDGITLQEGYAYVVSFSLEEEHLQPAPYPTNCTDYVALWEKNNKTGPRSQEVSKFST
ncbi:uncharacterized protein CDAR_367821 [Caerostris darwini]|uniref:Uncharacterized protein n=1 Tax=Caerostris darwini TaxID=1538125 RepID=A0AAV4T7F4_9ARAC|nr:uncharacterized protein CDAR_367821 [Caerostris darwini]